MAGRRHRLVRDAGSEISGNGQNLSDDATDQMIIECSKCGVQTERVRENSRMCRQCINAYARSYRLARPEQFKAYEKKSYATNRRDPEWVAAERRRGREYWQQLRHEAIMAYGGYVCTCCGETTPQFLTIDHVFNDGAKHRRELGNYGGNGKGASSSTLQWLKRSGFPAGFQVLCMNCNFGKQINKGVCPHKVSLSLVKLALVG